MILVVVGKIGSGKSTLSFLLAKKTGYDLIEVSSLVKQFVVKTYDRSVLQEAVDRQRNPNWLWDVLRAKLTKNCVICGLREPYLLAKLQQERSDVQVIYLTASRYQRYARTVKRDGYIAATDFYAQEKGDEKLGIDMTIEAATFEVDTGTDMTRSLIQLDQVLTALKITIQTYSKEES